MHTENATQDSSQRDPAPPRRRRDCRTTQEIPAVPMAELVESDPERVFTREDA